MLHHVSVGVSDIERAARFYDAAMSALGYKRIMEFPGAIAYGETAMPELWIGLPENRRQASVGNGVHIALNAPNRQAVHAFHEAALSAGGTDDGAPGPRPQYTPDYYGAFVRDPDGNKIEAMLLVTMERIIISPQGKRRIAKAKAVKKAAKGKGKARGAKKGGGRKGAGKAGGGKGRKRAKARKR